MTSNTEGQQGDNLDEIDKETLVSLLRDKGKELRQISTKLNKLEEKYVKIFKENKNYLKDKEAIEKFIKAVFQSEADKFLPYDTGSLDGTKLAETFQSKKDKYEQEKAILVKELVSSREEVEQRNQELTSKLSDAEKRLEAQETELSSYKSRVEQTDTIIQKLTQEINELNGVIANKDQEISKFKKLEDEMAALRAEHLIKELQHKNRQEHFDLRAKLDSSDRTDQLLKLKNDLEDAHEKIQRLEKEKAEIQAALTKLGAKQVHAAKRDFESQVNFSNGEEVLYSRPDEHNGNSARKHSSHLDNSMQQAMLQPPDLQFSRRESLEWRENGEFIPKDQHLLNQQYLKNVVLKYFIYSVGENEKEANILMSAICTILKMSKEERAMIENARKSSLWSKTKHLFVGKSDVNLHTHHTSS